MANIDTSWRDYLSNPLAQRTSGTSGAGGKSQVINAVFSDESKDEVQINDFLNLMIAQLKNQDFMNPVDDTQYVTQLAQFATMKAMDEMAEYSKTSYAMGLAGKNVTVAKFNVSGGVDKVSGPVQKVSFTGDQYEIYVDGKSWTLDQIMEVGAQSGAQDLSDVKNYKISASYADSKVSLSWPAATLDAVQSENVTYQIYYSKNKDMDTVEDVQKNGLVLGGDREKLTSDDLTGLEPGEYYFNVVITDHSNKQQYVYQKATCTVE